MTIDDVRNARLREGRGGSAMGYHTLCEWCGFGEAEYASSSKYKDEHICRSCREFRDDMLTEDEIWNEQQ